MEEISQLVTKHLKTPFNGPGSQRDGTVDNKESTVHVN